MQNGGKTLKRDYRKETIEFLKNRDISDLMEYNEDTLPLLVKEILLDILGIDSVCWAESFSDGKYDVFVRVGDKPKICMRICAWTRANDFAKELVSEFGT